MALVLLIRPAAHGDHHALAVGFSSQLFSDVNESDAMASIRVWADTILQRRGIDKSSAPVIFPDENSIRQDLQNETVDLFCLIPQELFLLENENKLEHLHFTSVNGRICEEYLLLVRSDSGISGISDLKGKRLALSDNIRMRLAPLWLETVLLETHGLDLQGFFAKVRTETKSSHSVLTTFFGKSDACLVNRQGFEVMVDLNPQLGKQLRILQVSPPFIPAVLCIRKGYDPALKKEVLAGIRELNSDISGQQILTVFGADRLVVGTLDDLKITRTWYDRNRSLKMNLLASGLPAAGKAQQ